MVFEVRPGPEHLVPQALRRQAHDDHALACSGVRAVAPAILVIELAAEPMAPLDVVPFDRRVHRHLCAEEVEDHGVSVLTVAHLPDPLHAQVWTPGVLLHGIMETIFGTE